MCDSQASRTAVTVPAAAGAAGNPAAAAGAAAAAAGGVNPQSTENQAHQDPASRTAVTVPAAAGAAGNPAAAAGAAAAAAGGVNPQSTENQAHQDPVGPRPSYSSLACPPSPLLSGPSPPKMHGGAHLSTICHPQHAVLWREELGLEAEEVRSDTPRVPQHHI
ncbi:hypothetical protein CYMTET_38876 [Cymbomonas tetramitiformis]|uniref:Uncharacterized protein n=1 Tax=Cymbomonas tetramitiformis TaxID=36881 RepID=A0AAE0CDC5_9CHLO|nr:hypothetical protein CYMTET_38876 [Cymbomonas tetramitiformis]